MNRSDKFALGDKRTQKMLCGVSMIYRAALDDLRVPANLRSFSLLPREQVQRGFRRR